MKFAIACKSDHFWHQMKAQSPELISEASGIYKCQDDLRSLLESNVDIVFFPHWSWVVPSEIINKTTCICFHSTPLPYGRGGSPIQNMVLNGHTDTQVVALKMTNQLDAGPIYLRQDVSLIGGGEEIFRRIYQTTISMMKSLLIALPSPTEQEGEVTIFTRRQSDDSKLDMYHSIDNVFDKIRILDVDNYPPAYIEIGDYKLTFTHPSMRLSGEIDAHVKIHKIR
ncbi:MULTISPECIES: formyltransferase family protein [Aeromonas]|uniref:formyltransferase family protein n=1 Tax=Aeromonas TaxID=642 RepID=UPI0022E5C0C5|nr:MULTISPECIES: formyltransferase family protein [Aeromonas]